MKLHLEDEDTQGMSDMNLIPLIDIMLVLMIIFMVTATVLNPSVVLDLPKTTASVHNQPPQVIQISIDENATVFWETKPITLSELNQNLITKSRLEEQPTIKLRVDKDAKYETVAQVLAFASESGLTKVAFVNTN